MTASRVVVDLFLKKNSRQELNTAMKIWTLLLVADKMWMRSIEDRLPIIQTRNSWRRRKDVHLKMLLKGNLTELNASGIT